MLLRIVFVLAIWPLRAITIIPPSATFPPLPTFAEMDINDDFAIDFNSIDDGGGGGGGAEGYDDGHPVEIPSIASNTLKAVALLRGPLTYGVVRFTQIGEGSTQVSGFVAGLIPLGQHGFHVHEHRVTGNDCESAGEHYNPTKENHGSPITVVAHVGDLGNIQADAKGIARFEIQSDKLSLRGKYSVIERGLVVHRYQDDLGMGYNQESLKSGNSGARIACGTIKFVSITKH